MELFVDEATSRTLLPRVDGQVVEAKLVALILTCTVGTELTAKGYFIDNDDDDDDDGTTMMTMMTMTRRQ